MVQRVLMYLYLVSTILFYNSMYHLTYNMKCVIFCILSQYLSANESASACPSEVHTLSGFPQFYLRPSSVPGPSQDTSDP